MEYEAMFAVSFKEYCQINDLQEASKAIVDKWRNDVIHNFSKEAPSKHVMELFKIPKEYKSSIEYHQYTIEEMGYNLDNKEKVLFIFMTLKIIG